MNILIASMAIGGAERCVHDTLVGLARRQPSGKLLLMHDLPLSYPIGESGSFPVIRLGKLESGARMPTVALEVLTTPNPVVYTHLIRASDLALLWERGVFTIPVIHNSEPGWQDSPSAFCSEQVPFLIAVSEDVRQQLLSAGCPKPVVVIRHELQRWQAQEEVDQGREIIRRRYGIRPQTLLIGMVGQFKAHKAYTRAVRVLAEVQRFAKAKLMILGGWDHDYGAGRVTYTATMKLALELGVLPDLIVPGPVSPVEEYYAAFDVFLNTSIYEGMSISTLEAAQSGCPIVTADVGGQREAVPKGSALIADSSNIGGYVEAIRERIKAPQKGKVLPPPGAPDLVPRLWCFIAQYGVRTHRERGASEAVDTLFVTSNLNPGGAQRSLTNLLSSLAGQHKTWLCVLGRVLGDHFLRQLESAGIPTLGISPTASQLDRMEQVLELIRRVGAKTICFWNVEAPMKLMLTKVLAQTGIRIVEVSPGPMLFTELDEAAAFQHRIAFSSRDYLNRLDCFVSKYRGGEPPERYEASPSRMETIPNGVYVPASLPSGPPVVRPSGFNPNYAVVTACRIVPNKRVEWLIEMMKLLSVSIPEVSLTIVGGVDQRHLGYWETVQESVRQSGLKNVHFAGPNSDVFSFLGEFRAFAMISNAQGCPNASLEAMAAGLPVVANADGGTAEQIVHGRTGFLVSGDAPSEMAGHLATLLRSPARSKRMGEAAQKRVKKLFSMREMAERYRCILNWSQQPSNTSQYEQE